LTTTRAHSLFFFYGSADTPDLHSFPTRRSSDLRMATEAPTYWIGGGPKVTQESHDMRTESDDCAENGGCSDTQMDRIYQYLDGALDAQAFAEVRVHIENCSACRSAPDLGIIIRVVVRRPGDEKAPDELNTRIMYRIAELKSR